MSAIIYLEGGGPGDLDRRCRAGFHSLLERCGLTRPLPKLVACGGRAATYNRFRIAHVNNRRHDYVAMLVDSEDPVAELEATWLHLMQRPGDGWQRPEGAEDDQVLFMTTCMETWILSDRTTLRAHYGAHLQESALLPLVDLERRERDVVQNALMHATRNCSNAYAKGKRSFEILGKLDASMLAQYLPSFVRLRRILERKL